MGRPTCLKSERTRRDSNPQPTDSKSGALSIELRVRDTLGDRLTSIRVVNIFAVFTVSETTHLVRLVLFIGQGNLPLTRRAFCISLYQS
jgi:hypothetical protein